jgi:hypothetical protein
MVKVRVRLLSQFSAIAKERAWNGSMAHTHYVRYLRSWYERNNLTSRQGKKTPVAAGGKPDVMSWYNAEENRAAKRRGWKKGDPDSPPRRNKKVTPLHKGKGKVASQKARARKRSKAFQDILQSGDTAVARKQKRAWVKELRATAKREPWREKQLTEQAQKLGFRGGHLVRKRRTK